MTLIHEEQTSTARERVTEELPETIRLTIWHDPLLSDVGFRADSEYVEYFWLPVLGPSCIWMLRRASQLLGARPEGIWISATSFGAALGIGASFGGQNLLQRTIARCVRFETARWSGPETLSVRSFLAPLSQRQLDRLPEDLRAVHGRFDLTDFFARTSASEGRARQMASSLLKLGEEPDAILAQLESWSYGQDLARRALEWAVTHG